MLNALRKFWPLIRVSLIVLSIVGNIILLLLKFLPIAAESDYRRFTLLVKEEFEIRKTIVETGATFVGPNVSLDGFHRFHVAMDGPYGFCDIPGKEIFERSVSYFYCAVNAFRLLGDCSNQYRNQGDSIKSACVKVKSYYGPNADLASISSQMIHYWGHMRDSANEIKNVSSEAPMFSLQFACVMWRYYISPSTQFLGARSVRKCV
jgi:hypothetical protein